MNVWFFIFCNQIILARRRRRSSRSTFRINKYHIGIGFMVIGLLFFFAKQFAPDAPILWRLSKLTSYAFWETWLVVFFILCVLVWILILRKWYLMKTLIKQFFCLMFLTFPSNRRLKTYIGKLDSVSPLWMILFMANLSTTWIGILTCEIGNSDFDNSDVTLSISTSIVYIKC